NADHHALQAWIASDLVASGRSPAIAFEQLETTSQAAVDEARRGAPRDADAIPRAVDWEKSGWPAWAMYRPIAEIAVTSGLTVVAANLPHETARALVRDGAASMSEADRARLGLDTPLAPALEVSLRRELE